MMAEFLKNQLDYIFFFYGSAFLLLIPICLFLKRRSCRKLPWLWLGWFGALHGANEWLDLLALSLEPGPVFDFVRTGLLIVSFVCLAEFGRGGTHAICGRGPGRWILAAMAALALVGGLAGVAGLFAATRYVLGLVGGLWAAGALFLAARTEPSGARPLHLGALGLAGYALAAGLVVSPAPFFPASWLNYDSFLAVTGVPIQLIRGLMAIWISASLCLFAQTCLERDQHFRVWFRHLIMWAMAGFTLLLISGWGFTQYLGDVAGRDKWDDYEHDMEMVRQSLMDKMAEADRLVKILSGSPIIFPALASRTLQTIHQANSVLDVCSQTLPESVCYVMDLRGLTIASSNRDRSDSFLGKSYAFRPYFTQAIQGSAGRYWALGVTSKELGYYASFPVRDHAGQIIGAAVIKRAYVEMQSAIHQHYLGLIIDQRGIVVMANRPDMVLRSLWPLSAAARKELLASRQFGDGPFTPILTQKPLDKSECLVQGKRMMVLVRPIPCEGCAAVIFGSIWPIAQARLLGISATLLFCLVLTGFLTSVIIMRESEEGFRQLFDNAADLLILHDKGKVIKVNQQACHCLGYTREEFLRMSVFEIETGYSKEFLIDLWERGGGDVTALSGIYRRKDGSTFPTEIRASEITYRGRTLRLAAARDITERKQSEEALRDREAKYRAAVETSVDGFCITDMAGRFLECNDAYAGLLGFSREELLSMTVPDIESQATPAEIAATIEKVRREGHAVFETKHRSKDGRGWPAEVNLAYWPIAGGRIFVFVRDITERKQSEEALRESEKRFRDVADNAHEWVWEVNAEGKYTYASPIVEKLLGYKPEEILYKHFYDLFIPEEREKLKEMASATFADKQPFREFINRNLHKDGSIVCLSTSGVPILDKTGNFLGYRGVDIDITERKKAEEALAASKEELQKSKENYQTLAGQLLTAQETEWKRLARELHDDLTQRLAALAMEVEGLALQMPSIEEASSVRMKSIKEKIVQLSMDTHELSRRLHPSILEDLGLTDAVLSELATFRQRHEILVYYLLEGIPSEVPQEVSLCIYRILQEGLSNISRHARATAIDILLVGRDGRLHLTIKDNGVGFDADKVKKKGGLGLASMRERAYLVGGNFYLRSQPGKGTVIEVLAPLSRST